MKKEAIIITSLFLVLTSTAIAAPEKRNEHANEHVNKQAEKTGNVPFLEEITVAPTEAIVPTTSQVEPTTSITVTPSILCDENNAWKNHGQYVSCVAKLHLGGQTTSRAAQSNVGKKHTDTPTTTPTVSPTVFTTPAPTVPVSITVTPPITAPILEAEFSLWPNFEGMWKNLVRLLPFFKHNKHS